MNLDNILIEDGELVLKDSYVDVENDRFTLDGKLLNIEGEENHSVEFESKKEAELAYLICNVSKRIGLNHTEEYFDKATFITRILFLIWIVFCMLLGFGSFFMESNHYNTEFWIKMVLKIVGSFGAIFGFYFYTFMKLKVFRYFLIKDIEEKKI